MGRLAGVSLAAWHSHNSGPWASLHSRNLSGGHTVPATSISKTYISGAVWYTEDHFMDALQDAIDRSHEDESSLCLVLLRLPGHNGQASRQLFAYAHLEDGNSFFGILSNGDYAICLPDSGYTEGAIERIAMARGLNESAVVSGLAVLDQEETAEELIHIAARACGKVGGAPFGPWKSSQPQLPFAGA